MNRTLLCSVLIWVSLGSFAQVRNINPDKNGEPWLAGGVDVTTFDKENAKALEITFGNQYKLSMPYKVNNAEEKYFRPIFNQTGGSCSQASGIGYIFTYEMNFARNLSANIAQNQYPSHFTYNFLNEGDEDNGSWVYDGFEIVKQMGCPSVADYGGGLTLGNSRWLSGYQNYLNGMSNKIESYNTISIRSISGLEELKKWLYNHGNGSSVGGLASFSVLMDDLEMDTIPYYSQESGSSIITKFGTESGGHAMTFVGYNDSLKFDINGDGVCTNDIDINGDGVVNLKDWEVGALIIANSWGTNWGDNGFSYMMYRLLAYSWSEGGLSTDFVHIMKPLKNYEPKLTLETQIEYTSRNKLKIYAGITNDLAGEINQNSLTFDAFSNTGGDFYMQGSSLEENKTIELGLDITPLKQYMSATSKVFLCIMENDPSKKHSGQIIYSKMHDLSGGNNYQGYPKNEPIKNMDMIAHLYGVNYTPFKISEVNLPKGVIGSNYEYVFNASGGYGNYSWEMENDFGEGKLPSGMAMSSDGVFSGIPEYIAPDYKWDIHFVAKDEYNIRTGKVVNFQLEGEYTSNPRIDVFNNKFKIYPNPIEDYFILEYLIEEPGYLTVSLFDVAGRKLQDIISNERTKGDYTQLVDVESLNEGIYLLRFNINGYSSCEKIIIH